MIERRFFIPEKAIDIYTIENSSKFSFIDNFNNGKIYNDITDGKYDLYYIDHDSMNDEEKEKYKILVTSNIK